MANELPSESSWAGVVSGRREMPEVIERRARAAAARMRELL
ncbi:hypothetical protein [Actinoplanes sp. NPDC051851]